VADFCWHLSDSFKIVFTTRLQRLSPADVIARENQIYGVKQFKEEKCTCEVIQLIKIEYFAICNRPVTERELGASAPCKNVLDIV